jgi:hypothetical protein
VASRSWGSPLLGMSSSARWPQSGVGSRWVAMPARVMMSSPTVPTGRPPAPGGGRCRFGLTPSAGLEFLVDFVEVEVGRVVEDFG